MQNPEWKPSTREVVNAYIERVTLDPYLLTATTKATTCDACGSGPGRRCTTTGDHKLGYFVTPERWDTRDGYTCHADRWLSGRNALMRGVREQLTRDMGPWSEFAELLRDFYHANPEQRPLRVEEATY